MEKRLAVLGAGFMGGALIGGIVKNNIIPAQNIVAIDPVNPASAGKLAEEYGVNVGEVPDVSTCDIVVFACKPQNFSDASAMYGEYFKNDTLYLSIMAGITTEAIEKAVNAPVIRLMPNLALSAGCSATAYCLGRLADETHAAVTEEIFAPTGIVRRVDEALMSTVTAVSGSGPAYVFYLIEAMSAAAVRQGMDRETADMLAVQTLIGSVSLIHGAATDVRELRARITSAKGTTEAAIRAMEEAGFFDVVEKGMQACKQRSDELSQLF